MQSKQYRHFEVDNQVCITKTPMTVCPYGYYPVLTEATEEVSMLCVDRDNALVPNMEHIMQTGHRLRVLRDQAIERRLPIHVLGRCQMAHLTKRVDSVQRSPATEFIGKYSKRNMQAYDDIEKVLVEARRTMDTPIKTLTLTDFEYEKMFDLIKEAIKYERVQLKLNQLNKHLPIIYVNAIERVQEPMIRSFDRSLDEKKMDEREFKLIKKQVKQLAQRVYLYTVSKLVEQANYEQTEVSRFDTIKHLEKVWMEIKDRISSRSIESIEKWLKSEKVTIENEKDLYMQANDLVLPEEQLKIMSQQEMKQIQLVLEKVLLGYMQLTYEMHKSKDERREESLFNKMFKKDTLSYTELVNMYKRKYHFDY